MQVTITEDQALGQNVSLKSLINQEIKKGFKIVNEYNHPAVGKVVVLQAGSR